MKKFLLLATALIVSTVVMNAQDLLTKSSGDDLQVIVKEVNANEVKYVLFSEPNGVLYTMPKSEILMIRYASGRKEVFANSSVSNNTRTQQRSMYSGYGNASQIYVGMKYKELKNIYDYRDYDSRAYKRYSPTWAGVGSFFIPGLGQICCGETWRGLGQVGINVGLSILANACMYGDSAGGYLAFTLAKLGYGIWSIVDAVHVAKVKNMYEADLRSLRSSVEFDMYPSLNAIPTQSGLGIAPGMTLSLTF